MEQTKECNVTHCFVKAHSEASRLAFWLSSYCFLVAIVTVFEQESGIISSIKLPW